MRIDPLKFGQDYTAEDTQIVFSQPELRGGVAATGTALVTDGLVYDVVLTSPGSGYTKHLLSPSQVLVLVKRHSKNREG